MDIPEQNLQNIQNFAANRAAAEKESTSQPLSATALHAYARRLDGTLRELQEQVRRQEDELRKLREIRSHGLLESEKDQWARVSEARRAKRAYDSLLQAEEDLPVTDSVLPSLIAIEETSRLIKESKGFVSVTAERLSADREQLRVEEANLRDSRAIANGLGERLQRIRNANARKQEQTPSQVAQEVLSQQKTRSKVLEREFESLRSSLNTFIDETLAPMLAAENLGGPTVGDALEVSDTTLNAGYTAHGKPKKQKEKELADNGGGQQMIDKFVRRTNDGSNLANKREAAATEMHELLDSLLEAGTSYVTLERDSAIPRFLVRAKVAQFHPRDARRLRLIDFGRSLTG
ncbi:uncharacterized protein N7484_004300 [Penicillium longicatenatum]|uniref:uncharacterized protein n=1 Tax=Penicillium longicatenatum TaxID=1561947 RepID=UPI0025495432|nr:uncharacterized protein N7484_004300 [Penicillium longicatenatum]KAJ5650577.1 hypothetical protein N7484_004300 [Penicillium longicatenatum]